MTGVAGAQPAGGIPAVDRATREIDKSLRAEAEKELMRAPPKPGKVKEEAEKVVYTGPQIFVKAIRLEGVETFPVEDFRNVLKDYEGRDVYETELKDALTGAITREYLKKGVIATAFIPPQQIENDTITVQVIEAKMGELEVNKARYFVKERIDYYWPIEAGEVLRYDRMSRALQFMNKNPDREVRATLAPGKKPGTTSVIINQTTSFPFHATASMDNEGAVQTGKIRTGLGFVENNVNGLDDTLIGGYSGGKNFGSGYGYHKIPVTNFGTTAMYGYSRSKAFPKKDFTPFNISSMSESYSAYLYQDLYQKDVYKGDVSIGFEANNKRVVATNGTLNADRLRIVRMGPSFVERSGKSGVYIKPQYSQGLNFLGARRKTVYTSRQADNTFSKFGLTAQFQQLLVYNMQAQVRFAGQWATEKLTPQEEIALGGIDSVRGYPSGDYLADSGFAGNIELLVPAAQYLPDWFRIPYGERPLGQEITGIFFFDYGYGQKRGDIQGEQSKRRLASLGAGVRMRLLNQANLRLEWGFPLDPANYPFSEFSRQRLHFSVDIQDDIPREVDRLMAEMKRKRIEKEAWQIVNDETRDGASYFRKTVYGYFILAERAEADGDPVMARKYYRTAALLGRALHKRAEKYIEKVRETITYLKTQDALAEEYVKAGDLIKAKEVSEKIRDEAILKPLTVRTM